MRSYGTMLAISIWSSCAFGADWNSVFNDAKSFGKQTAEELQSVVRNPNPQDVPFYTDKPPHAGAWGVTDFVGPATKHIGECSAGKGSTPQDRKECEAVVFLAKEIQDRPHVEVRPDDPLIEGGKDIIDNATGSNTGGECVLKPGGSTINKEEWCEAGRDKRVGACSKTLEVRCENGDGCDNGGIVPNSAAGDMSYRFWGCGDGNYCMDFGTIGDNYWRGGMYDRTLGFDIRGIEDITKFALTYASFDDWLLVKVNGHLIYVGPYGGDRLEPCARGVCFNGDGAWGGWELKTSWSVGLNIDIRPYLKEGRNEIYTRTMVGGKGESFVRFTARSYCPCSEFWQDDCASIK